MGRVQGACGGDRGPSAGACTSPAGRTISMALGPKMVDWQSELPSRHALSAAARQPGVLEPCGWGEGRGGGARAL
jgi:hypothetical protein